MTEMDLVGLVDSALGEGKGPPNLRPGQFGHAGWGAVAGLQVGNRGKLFLERNSEGEKHVFLVWNKQPFACAVQGQVCPK